MPTSNQRTKRNIFLVGPMGVGKTTVGRALAQQLHLEFIDSDQEIERRAGANIAWIFDVEGEPGFRERETAVLDDLTQLEDVLIATGGGSVLKPENREFLRTRGLIIFLDTSLDMQIKRTAKDKKRPLLQTGTPAPALRELKPLQDPLYNDLADIKVAVGDSSSRKIITSIVRKLAKINYV